MPTIDASFTDPAVIRVDRPDATWFISGADDADRASIERLTSTGDGAAFCRAHGNAQVVAVTMGDHPGVRLWRALFTTHEAFFAVRPDRDIVVSDHFLNALAALPVAERTVDDEILTFHYLTRATFGTASYLSGVTRVPHGAQVDIDAATGTWTTARFDEIAAPEEPRPRSEYVDAIERAMAQSLAVTGPPDDTALLFSGGVDSTLILAMDPDLMTPVTFVPDSPEFAVETDYARRAAGSVGVTIREVPVHERDFVTNLEIATDTIGLPVIDDSAGYFDQLFRTQPFETFVIGLGADSAFGTSMKLTKFANWFRFPGIRHGLAVAAPRAVGHLGYRMGQVAARADGLAKDPMHVDGFAAETLTHGDTSLFQSIVGPELPRRIKELQLSYVTERVEETGRNGSSFMAHMEISHWMNVFANAMLEPRMMTHALGEVSVGPYADARVLRELSRIPLEDRYVDGYRSKWILKEVLARRMPDYPVEQRKQATALPWERFYSEGPLSDVWDRYDVPDVFPDDAKERIRTGTTITTWNAITWAIWDARVRRNPDVQPHPAVESLSASFA